MGYLGTDLLAPGTRAARRALRLIWTPTTSHSFALLVPILLTMMPARHLLSEPVNPMDEGLLLAYGSEVLQGGIPNETFFTQYGPATYWVLGVAFRAFGYSIEVERLVGLAYCLVLVISISALLLRKKDPAIGLLAGSIAALLTVDKVGIGATAWTAALAFALIGVLAADRVEDEGRGKTWSLAAGLCFGMACSFRLQMALPVALFLVGYWLARRSLSAPAFAVGLLIGGIPTLINITQVGPLAFWKWQIFEAVFVLPAGRRLPLGPHLLWPAQLTLGVCVAVIVALLASGIVLRRQRRDAFALPVALFCVGLMPQALQRADGSHVAMVACVVVPLGLLIDLPSRARPLDARLIGPLLACAILPWVLQSYLGSSLLSIGILPSGPAQFVTHQGATVIAPWGDDPKDLQALLDAVDAATQPGDSIFVGPDDLRTALTNDTFLYFLLPELVPGSFYMQMDPLGPNAPDSSLEDELRKTSVVVLVKGYSRSLEPNASQVLGPSGPNEVISDEFSLVGSWGRWSLYRNVEHEPQPRLTEPLSTNSND